MKNSILRSLSLAVLLVSPLAIAAGCSHATSHEVSHSESDSKGWFGGKTHEANTVYKNSDGSTSVEKESTTSKDGKTVITRERTTTAVDGSVKTEHETRTVIKGTDETVTDTHSKD